VNVDVDVAYASEAHARRGRQVTALEAEDRHEDSKAATRRIHEDGFGAREPELRPLHRRASVAFPPPRTTAL
jgi:hypothetical protein